MYTGIGFVCKCISHHVAKMADQGIHQNYKFCNLIQAGGKPMNTHNYKVCGS